MAGQFVPREDPETWDSRKMRGTKKQVSLPERAWSVGQVSPEVRATAQSRPVPAHPCRQKSRSPPLGYGKGWLSHIGDRPIFRAVRWRTPLCHVQPVRSCQSALPTHPLDRRTKHDLERRSYLFISRHLWYTFCICLQTPTRRGGHCGCRSKSFLV